MKKGFILTVMLVSVLALGHSQAGSWNVTNVATWVEAVGAIRSGGNNKEYVITVNGNISVPSSTENTFGSVNGITVNIQGNGTLSLSANGTLLQIGTGQTVIAKDLTLRGRTDNNNSLVYVGKSATFRMEGSATVSGNTVNSRDGLGGGVYVIEGNFIMQDRATVKDNITQYSDGGGVYICGGNFTMQGSASVSGNTAGNSGGGVCIFDLMSISFSDYSTISKGVFIMQGNALVSRNTAAEGGGVYICGGKNYSLRYFGGTFSMQGNASVSSNNATGYESGGGGVYINGDFTMRDNASVSGNTATGRYGSGGGIYIFNANRNFTMQTGTISGNTATSHGGGVAGTLIMNGGTITGNTASRGGGVSGRVTMNDGVISGNTASDAGGGVFSSSFTMRGGTISNNTATFHGGGVYNDWGIFTKTGGTIYGEDSDQSLKNIVISRLGYVVYDDKNSNWRNASAGPTMSSDSYGFWLNDGDLTMFPSSFTDSGFTTTWKRSNFNNTLSLTENTIKSSSSNYLWILQRISGNAYTFKRSDAVNTMTLTIRLDGNSLVISGDSGNGQDNWNGTWAKQR